MVCKRLFIVLIGCLIGVACKSRKSYSTALENAPGPVVRIGIADQPVSPDSVMLSFVVHNYSDTAQQFCKWDTPFEPLLGKYLSVTDETGTEAEYRGAMARRVMPPSPESYILINPHDSVAASFNLAKGYAIKPGHYIIKYIASGLSGIQPGNVLKVSVPVK